MAWGCRPGGRPATPTIRNLTLTGRPGGRPTGQFGLDSASNG